MNPPGSAELLDRQVGRDRYRSGGERCERDDARATFTSDKAELVPVVVMNASPEIRLVPVARPNAASGTPAALTDSCNGPASVIDAPNATR